MYKRQGVPSPGVWEHEARAIEQDKKKQLAAVRFRNKDVYKRQINKPPADFLPGACFSVSKSLFDSLAFLISAWI